MSFVRCSLSVFVLLAAIVTQAVGDSSRGERQVLRIFGSVENSAGPVAGAVVVTSAGGTTATDASGEFSLEVETAAIVTRLEVSAIVANGSDAYSGRRVVPVAPGGDVPVGRLVLLSTSLCDAHWLPTFDGIPGTSSNLRAATVFDDGSGPALFVAGSFSVAKGVVTHNIAKWDGSTWSPLGVGTNNDVNALVVFDDGSGPALYAGGSFSKAGDVTGTRFVARWDGTVWSSVGGGTLGSGSSGGTVNALAVHDDGTGPALYAGGYFTSAGGVPASKVAKWDGSAWSALGAGVDDRVHAFTVFDDGTGPALFVGGEFTNAGGSPASRIAKWDGAQWSALGSGVSGDVYAITSFDDGHGPALIVGGAFWSAGTLGALRLAKWDGSNWSSFGSGASHDVDSFGVFDLGAGPELFVGGGFASIDGIAAQGIAKWNGATWSPVGGGVAGGVRAMARIDFGSGSEIFAVGGFEIAGTVPAHNVASWNGSNWSALGTGLDGRIDAMVVHDDGTGPALYVGGDFSAVGGTLVNHIAKWDGETWSSLGGGMNAPIATLAVYDDGGGAELYAGGFFAEAGGAPAFGLAKWDGTRWSDVGNWFNGSVTDLVVWNDGSGPALIASTGTIWRWHGSNWSPLGGGLSQVQTIGVFDLGNGAELYAGGMFNGAGLTLLNRVAKWTGWDWESVGGGVSGGSITQVLAFEVFDDGTGPALFVGGDFSKAGGLDVNNLAKWNGTSWAAVGGGIGGLYDQVYSLRRFTDENGPALFAGGWFDSAGGVAANNIAKWQGSTWSPLGSGTSDAVTTLTIHHAGGASALYVGGKFWVQYDSESSYLAKWGGGCITEIPGCSANPVLLVSLSTAAKLGQPFGLLLRSNAQAPGAAMFFVGLEGTNGFGCGVLAPGIGEILLDLTSPPPWFLGQVALFNHLGIFPMSLPSIPSLNGVTVAFQGFVGSGGTPKASNALSVTLSD